MASKNREQVAILGGGIAALTSAYELTKTEELRQKYEVTIYQMGWRLGGKLASGRNEKEHLRNEEHGLHVWFGYYENAFALMQDCYKEINKIQPEFKFKHWQEAFKPQSLTPIGEFIDGKYTYLPFTWATNPDTPGDGKVLLSPWAAIVEIINILKIVFSKFEDETEAEVSIEHILPNWVSELIQNTRKKNLSSAVSELAQNTISGLLGVVHEWAKVLDLDKPDTIPAEVEAIQLLLAHFKKELNVRYEKNKNPNIDAYFLLCVADVLIATVTGILNPKYGILKDMDLGRIDSYEYRDWLIENGCSVEVARKWSVVKALYDAYFYYIDGDLSKPNVAAGTAVRVLIRTIATYKGAILYLIQTGMGEGLIAPIYNVLKSRGVNFKFFHKVKKIELSESKNQIERVIFSRQVNIRPEATEYKPTKFEDGFDYWPSEPFWDQIVDGDKMQKAKVNFESNWCNWHEAGEVKIENGSEFDRVILAISLGAFQKLNDEPSICQELIDNSPAFADLVNHSVLVPSMGVQLWMDKSLVEMGWDHGKPAMDGAAEPLSVWTDMTQVLEFEKWLDNKPKSLQYLTGVLNTQLFRSPTKDASVPGKAMELLKSTTIDWLEKYTYSIWSKAVGQNPQGGIDWNVLHDESGSSGKQRLNAQYLRPNVDPTECCVLSTAGNVKYRLKANESGFINLTLAGEWTRTGMNTSCVEGAVMSGMLASRAISGYPKVVVGENFMQC